MGGRRFLLLACAILACVNSFPALSNRASIAETMHSAQLHASVDDDYSVHADRPVIARDTMAGQERAFFNPTALGEGMRNLLLKVMGPKNILMKPIAWLMSRMYFEYWVRKGLAPSDLARLLKLSKGEGLYSQSRELKLLEQYVNFLHKRGRTGVTFMEVMAKHFNDETKFVPFLFKYTISKHTEVKNADALLDAFFAKWQSEKKPLEDVLDLLKVKKVGTKLFSYKKLRRLEKYRDQYILDTKATNVETVGSLLAKEFDGEDKLAILAVNALAVDATQAQGQYVLLELCHEWERRQVIAPELVSKVFSKIVDPAQKEAAMEIVPMYKKFYSEKWPAK